MKKKQWYPFAMLGCAAMVNLVYMGLIYNMLGLYTPSILQEFPDFSRSSFTVTMTLINLMAAAANMIHTPVRENKLSCFWLCKTVMNNLKVYLVQEIAGEEERSQVVSLGVAFMSFGCAVGVYMVQPGYDLCGSYRSIYVLYIVLAALCMVLTRYLRNHRRNSAI